jgi:hypothetical protein
MKPHQAVHEAMPMPLGAPHGYLAMSDVYGHGHGNDRCRWCGARPIDTGFAEGHFDRADGPPPTGARTPPGITDAMLSDLSRA